MYHKWQSYDVRLLRYWVQQTEFFVILDYFCPFTTLKTLEVKILKKCDNKMMYGSCDMKLDIQNFLSLCAIFCSFTPLKTKKIKILKKWKTILEISLFYTSVSETMITCYPVPEIWRMTNVIFIFHFGLIFALLPR